MPGDKSWSDGEVVTAALLNSYLRDQVITVCTTATHPASPIDGRTIYETDTQQYLRYDLATTSWVVILTTGAWRTYTPVVSQTGSLTCTVVRGAYARSGRTVTVSVSIVLGAAGTSGQQIEVTVPLTGVTGSVVAGTYDMFDASGPTIYSGVAILNLAGTGVALRTPTPSNSTLGVAPAFALATGDTISLLLTYEAGA